MPNVSLETIISFAKRRGFIFPSSEIYGGFRSSYDYGPLGVELKNAVKRLWWDAMVTFREDVVGLDSAILMSPKVWEASGHTSAGFADLLAECPTCHKRWRVDHVKGICPDDQTPLGEPRKFNLLIQTHLGPVEDESTMTFFRPETAQGIFVNFSNVAETMRMKMPFGIAQVGKAFRNEITPGPFTFRMREFEQMEMQWFYDPRLEGEGEKWYEYWKKQRLQWYTYILGIDAERLRFHDHAASDLAHYAKAATDIDYAYPWGWDEFEGIHMRGDWDLSQHEKFSGQELRLFDEHAKEHVVPHVIETSGGVDRATLVLLFEHYDEEEVKGEKRVVLRLPAHLAPLPVAVLPIVKNDEKIVAKAKEVVGMLRGHVAVAYDEAGSIGRRYRRLDEIGTSFAITIDFDTLENNTVTIRDRDSMQQERVNVNDLPPLLKEKTRVPQLYV